MVYSMKMREFVASEWGMHDGFITYSEGYSLVVIDDHVISVCERDDTFWITRYRGLSDDMPNVDNTSWDDIRDTDYRQVYEPIVMWYKVLKDSITLIDFLKGIYEQPCRRAARRAQDPGAARVVRDAIIRSTIMSKTVELSVVKEAVKNGEDVSGVTFVNAKGATGTVLPGKSLHLKLQAEMTCTTDGCTETHVREQSDWHQSHKCRTHAEGKKGSNPNNLGGGLKLADGSVVRLLKVRPTDPPDVVQAKEQNNAVFEAERQARDAAAAIDKAQRAAERKAAQEKAKAEKNEKLLVEKAAKLKEQSAKMKEYVAKVVVK